MVKGKISSQDFMNLLDDQEVAHETLAFSPPQAKRGKASTSSSKGRKKQAPVNKAQVTNRTNWLNLALTRSPIFITTLVTSDRVLKLLKTLNASLDEVINALYEAKTARVTKG